MDIYFETESHSIQDSQPLRMVIAGKFTSVSDDVKPLKVDKNNFKEVISHFAGELLFEVPNHLSTHPGKLQISLRITDLTSFSPSGIATQVPELKLALDLRDRLAALASGALTYSEFETDLDTYRCLDAFTKILDKLSPRVSTGTSLAASESLEPPSKANTTHTASTENDAIDRILEMVSQKDEIHTEPALTSLHHVISQIVNGKQRNIPSTAYTEALASAEQILSRQIDVILHHPLFYECEAFWRGLKLLVDRTDFRKDIQIDLLGIERDQFGNDIHERMLAPMISGQIDYMPSLILIPYAIYNRPTDLDQLKSLGTDANELQIPILISASPTFFHLNEGSDAELISNPGSIFSRPEYAQWNSLRDKDASRWLCVCFNRFQLRTAYTSNQRHTLGLSETFKHHRDYLWGEPVWLVACLIASSFSRTGWPTEITGLKNGRIDDLSTRMISDSDTQAMEIPLEMAPSAQLTEDLSNYGFTTLMCKPNRDSAYLLRAPMLHRPEVYDDESANIMSRTMAQLPYQLLASRISHTLSINLAELRSQGLTSNELGNAIVRAIQNLISDTGEGADVSVDIQNLPDISGKQQVELTICTGKEVVNGANVWLSFTV